MALDLRIAKSLSCQGKTFSFSRAATPDGLMGTEPPLAAAKIGALTTRTNGTTGTLTMATGHGITTAAIIDIYWDGGAAYGLTVGTVSVDSVPFTTAGGTMGTGGEALPADETPITAMVVHSEAFAVVDTNVYALAVYASGVACIARFRNAADNADVAVIIVSPGNEGYIWFDDDDSGSATPFSADAASVLITHGSSAGTISPSVYAYVN